LDTIRTIAWMKETARQARAESRVIGFVPTMGALHAGHLSLVERARRDCDPVIASIFVNPKQFGPKEDFAKYPRTLEKDAAKLAAAGVGALFLPEAAEMYPAGFATYVNVEGLSERLEGRTRPGHFCGVTTVVLKLLEIVQPTFAYFGRKDAQQARLITIMARDLNLDTQIVLGPIVREGDGLAMSSRNVYLNAEERRASGVLHCALAVAREEVRMGVRDTLRLQEAMRRALASEPLARLDYLEIVDAETFEPMVRVARPAYVLLAAYLGRTRLIDNMLIEPSRENPAELVCHI
jgi:pantoate--beta-alanine ligase